MRHQGVCTSKLTGKVVLVELEEKSLTFNVKSSGLFKETEIEIINNSQR